MKQRYETNFVYKDRTYKVTAHIDYMFGGYEITIERYVVKRYIWEPSTEPVGHFSTALMTPSTMTIKEAIIQKIEEFLKEISWQDDINKQIDHFFNVAEG